MMELIKYDLADQANDADGVVVDSSTVYDDKIGSAEPANKNK